MPRPTKVSGKRKLLRVADHAWQKCRDSQEFFEGYCKELIRTDRLLQRMKRKPWRPSKKAVEAAAENIYSDSYEITAEDRYHVRQALMAAAKVDSFSPRVGG